MGAPEIRYLGDLQRLELKAGDRFVLTVDRHLSAENHAAIQRVWADFVGQADRLPLLVLEPGMKLGVIATGED